MTIPFEHFICSFCIISIHQFLFFPSFSVFSTDSGNKTTSLRYAQEIGRAKARAPGEVETLRAATAGATRPEGPKGPVSGWWDWDWGEHWDCDTWGES